MRSKIILIFGSGSFAYKHASVLKKIYKDVHINFFSQRKTKNYLNNKDQLKKINPHLIIIASKTSDHFKHLELANRYFKNKIILIDKPLFHKMYDKNFKNNKILVNYNFRFNHLISYLKKIIILDDIFSININCFSYLPKWRNKRNYKYSYSSDIDQGGGVALDLSHELDYVQYLFGPITKILYSYSKNISNLKINCDDILILNCLQKKIKTFINLNFYSRINRREIIINGYNKTIKCDLLTNTIIIESNKLKKYKFNLVKNHSLINVHKKIKENKLKDFCTYEEGIDILKLIQVIKKKI